MKPRLAFSLRKSPLNSRECYSTTWLPSATQRESAQSRSDLYTPINFQKFSKGDDGSAEQIVDQLRSGYISFKADIDKICNNLKHFILSEKRNNLLNSVMMPEILEDLGELRNKFLGREIIIKRLIKIATEHSPKQVKLSSPREGALKKENDYLKAMNKRLTEDLENATKKFINFTNIDFLSPRTESPKHCHPGLLDKNQATPLEELDKLLEESQRKNEIYSRKLMIVSISIQRFLNAINNLQKGAAKPDGQVERLRKEFKLNKTQLLSLLEDLTRSDDHTKDDICSKLPKFRTSTPDQICSHSIAFRPLHDPLPEDPLFPQFQSIFKKTKDDHEENIRLLEKQIKEYKSKLEQQQRINAKLLKEKE